MCLAIPGKLMKWLDRDPILARGLVEFGGVQRECHLACVLEASEGEYLIVHAGVAISRVHAAEAERLLREIVSLGESVETEA